MKRTLYWLWLFVKPLVIASARILFWIVTAPVGILFVFPRSIEQTGDRKVLVWLPEAWMVWIESKPLTRHLQSVRRQVDRDMPAEKRLEELTEREVLLRVEEA